jgi:hypothetical protein
VKQSRGLWVAFVLAAVLTVAIVLVPVLLIRPFKPQTPTKVAVSYRLRTVSPWLAPALALLSVGLAVAILRRRPHWALRTLVGVLLVPVGGAAWLSRKNHFEWMFAPLPSADYARTTDVKFVDESDMVVAVEVSGDAVAYPVRQMAYHHLVNDQVGGLPVVSTY